ncbi:PH domain-containing protein [Alteromonas genovensis]|uniref:PH domain-containing protein n=1 Tax=Alteromonas genovensis TaxID=471225 RepID=UPI002FE323BA
MFSASKAAEFSNEPLSQQDLPALDLLALTPVSKKYRTINLGVCSTVTVLLLGALSVAKHQPWFRVPNDLHNAYPYACLVIFTLGFLWFTYHFFADKKVRFAVREQDVSKESGLFFRQLSCQPILRVQHVELKRGPLDRWAGLASLQVFSAGGEMHTFEIPGLEIDEANQIRQFILDHKDVSAL